MARQSLRQALEYIDAKNRCIRTWMRSNRHELLEEFGEKRLDLRRFVRLARKLRLTNDQGGEISSPTLSRTWKEVCAEPRSSIRPPSTPEDISPGVRRLGTASTKVPSESNRFEQASSAPRSLSLVGSTSDLRGPAEKINEFREKHRKNQLQMPDIVD